MKVPLSNLSPGRRSPNRSALPEANSPLTAPGSDFGFRLSAFGLRISTARRGERGIALVITLIMLAVITFMAIAFLVLSRGERTSTATATDQTIARLAANNALERAQAELVLPMIASGNFASGGLMVSTNFINPLGFIRSANPQVYNNVTNVAYNYGNGSRMTLADSLQNLANLQINPRPPVFIVTNRFTGSNDFRYYLDLNRNGVFDLTGPTWVTNVSGQRVLDAKANPLVDNVQGDPQWIGGLEFPDRRYSADNRFLYRYAYLVVPVSQTLDFNYIHNAAANPLAPRVNLTGADYLRNQGVGPWEINLAAFLYDLNTNIYGWGPAPRYNPLIPNGVGGNAYVDAAWILANRYGGVNTPYPSALMSVATLFSVNGQRAFRTHAVDGYTAGPVMTTASGFNFDPDSYQVDRTVHPWPGADNTNHFYSTQDLFDPNKTSPNFALRLQALGTNIDTYDRYTFYRLLSQLGTDSAPEPAGKINLNYDNLVQANTFGVVSATNFFAWKPSDFFAITANALLANAGFTNLTVTNLIIYPFNFYTPAVHRLLQLAANIYDASGATNRALAVNPQYSFPTVFRPIFRRVTTPTNTLVEIVGYREVVNANIANGRLAPIMVELDNPTSPVGGPNKIPDISVRWNPNDINDKNEPMVSGIPLIIGAKKGFPNFNELAMQTEVSVSRLLEFRRNSPTGPVVRTNQMYTLTITNSFGLEAWNSYETNYPRNLQLETTMQMTAIITNEIPGATPLMNNRVAAVAIVNTNNWRGWTLPNQAPYSMILPFGITNGFLWTNSTALDQAPWLVPQTHLFPPATRGTFYVPHWWLNLNTRLLFVLVDTAANRIVDYVNINNWQRTVDITTNLLTGANMGNFSDYKNPANEWITNRLGNSLNPDAPTYGIINQIQVGLNGAPDMRSYSMDPFSGLDAESAVDGFRFNLLGLSPIYPKDSGKVFTKTNIFYAPLDPYRPIYVHTTWQANDPLVHYTAGDLIDTSFSSTNVDFASQVPPLNNLGRINTRYRPWGGNPENLDPLTDYSMAVKDPFVNRSDDWDFPTNKFPNIGWLGRVHRGTPWQTVFLKSTNFLQTIPVPLGTRLDLNPNMLNWARWSGNPVMDFNFVTNGFPPHIQTNLVPANYFYGVPDAWFTSPTNDWHILDLFTTAFNDNAGRGQLSVNQTNLAAWSAVLSGVNVLSNTPLFVTNLFIQPAGVYNSTTGPLPPLVTIVNGINNTRTNFVNHAFSRLGDILATPELTMNSPFLTAVTPATKAPVTDAVVERIPQQILGLLHGGEQPPRFVIYSYGQALKPAVHSLYQGPIGNGAYFGMCTNYQITAEVATRAVVRVDGAPGKPRTVIENFTVLPPD